MKGMMMSKSTVGNKLTPIEKAARAIGKVAHEGLRTCPIEAGIKAYLGAVWIKLDAKTLPDGDYVTINNRGRMGWDVFYQNRGWNRDAGRPTEYVMVAKPEDLMP